MDSSLTAANCGHRSSLMAGWVLLVYESCSKRMAQLAAVFNMDFFFFPFSLHHMLPDSLQGVEP